MKTELFDELIQRLNGVIPDSLNRLGEDLEHHQKAMLAATLNKLDLVTREEFDRQTRALSRAEQRVAELERRLEDAFSTEND